MKKLILSAIAIITTFGCTISAQIVTQPALTRSQVTNIVISLIASSASTNAILMDSGHGTNTTIHTRLAVNGDIRMTNSDPAIYIVDSNAALDQKVYYWDTTDDSLKLVFMNDAGDSAWTPLTFVRNAEVLSAMYVNGNVHVYGTVTNEGINTTGDHYLSGKVLAGTTESPENWKVTIVPDYGGRAIIGGDNTTNSAIKRFTVGVRPYSSNSVPFAAFGGMASNGFNYLAIGGGPTAMQTNMAPAGRIEFYTGNAPTTAGGGTLQWVIDESGNLLPNGDGNRSLGSSTRFAENVYGEDVYAEQLTAGVGATQPASNIAIYSQNTWSLVGSHVFGNLSQKLNRIGVLGYDAGGITAMIVGDTSISNSILHLNGGTSQGPGGAEVYIYTSTNFNNNGVANLVPSWQFTSNGHFRPFASGANDIGTSTNLVREIYVTGGAISTQFGNKVDEGFGLATNLTHYENFTNNGGYSGISALFTNLFSGPTFVGSNSLASFGTNGYGLTVVSRVNAFPIVAGDSALNNNQKVFRFGLLPHTNGALPTIIFSATANATTNLINHGGGTGLGFAMTGQAWFYATNVAQTSGVEAMRLNNLGQFSVGTNTPTTGFRWNLLGDQRNHGILEFDHVQAGGTVSANSARIYCMTNASGEGEMYVKNEVGTETEISPHDQTGPSELYSSEDENPFVFGSNNEFLGKFEYVNLTRMARLLQAQFPGEKFYHKETFSEHNTRLGLAGDDRKVEKNWDTEQDARQARYDAERIAQSERLQSFNSEKPGRLLKAESSDDVLQINNEEQEILSKQLPATNIKRPLPNHLSNGIVVPLATVSSSKNNRK